MMESPQSSNLNIIENLWTELKAGFHQNLFNNLLKSLEARDVLQEGIGKLMDSMPRRCGAGIAAYGQSIETTTERSCYTLFGNAVSRQLESFPKISLYLWYQYLNDFRRFSTVIPFMRRVLYMALVWGNARSMAVQDRPNLTYVRVEDLFNFVPLFLVVNSNSRRAVQSAVWNCRRIRKY